MVFNTIMPSRSPLYAVLIGCICRVRSGALQEPVQETSQPVVGGGGQYPGGFPHRHVLILLIDLDTTRASAPFDGHRHCSRPRRSEMLFHSGSIWVDRY